MSTALIDSYTMLRRQLRHLLRYPSLTMIVIAMPVIFLLLFVYVFGGTMGAGLGGGGRGQYATYVTPGIIMIGLTGVAQGTSFLIGRDMEEGIIARFRTMAIARGAVLTGHVVSTVVEAALGIVAVFGFALLVGFRSSAGPMAWLAAAGMLLLTAFAIAWLSVALGLAAGSAEAASNLPMPLTLLPFLGSGFVPTASMPVGLRWFAEYQPFTPIMETLRGLLVGGAIGSKGVLAVAWCVGIALVGYLWSRRLYNRDPAPAK